MMTGWDSNVHIELDLKKKSKNIFQQEQEQHTSYVMLENKLDIT